MKETTRNKIIDYIFAKQNTSRQEIAHDLRISMPTVLQTITSLQDMGIVRENGQMMSTGGRKASVISLVKDMSYSLGIEITKNHVSILTINMRKEILSYERIKLRYVNTAKYYSEIDRFVIDYIKQQGISEEKIAGIGFSIPGILNIDNSIIADSHVLGIENIPCSVFCNHLPWKAYFINDANAAGLAEIRSMPADSTMVYISLSNSVGGAVFVDGDLYIGKNQRAGEFGHIRIVPNGRKCYCGQRGCSDAYCSALTLNPSGDNLEGFFEKLHAGDNDTGIIWHEYLINLSKLITTIKMSFDSDIVLGGYVGNFLEPWLPDLQKMVAQQNPFERTGDIYLHVSRYKMESSAYGAALVALENFVSTL